MLKLNGKPFQLHPTPPSVLKLTAALDKCPADELYLSADLAKLGVSANSVGTYSNLIPTYTCIVGKLRYYGNPKAIAELRKQVAA